MTLLVARVDDVLTASRSRSRVLGREGPRRATAPASSLRLGDVHRRIVRAVRCRSPGRPSRRAPRLSRPRSSRRARPDGPSSRVAPTSPVVRAGPRRPAQPACPDRLTHHRLGVVEVDLPVTSVRELGELLAIHDGVGPGLVRRATLDGDVVGEVGRPGSQRDREDRRGQRGSRSRRVRPTPPGRRTLAPPRPAQPWRRHRDAGSRSGSVPATCRVRSARSAGGPRPRGRRTP